MLKFLTAGFANDIIVVKQPDGDLCCLPVNVRFPHQDDVTTTFWNEKNVTVSINGTVRNFSLRQLNPRNESNEGGFRFTSPCLKSMRLCDDLNHITFTNNFRGQDVEVKARMFLWCSNSRIVTADVDGTITKSDKRGIFLPYVGIDWTHDGVCHLFSAIQKNGYKVIYLTGRPSYLAEETRKLLDGIKQDGKVLPKGPVIVSPDGLRGAISREFSDTQDADFKIPMLKQIRKLFEVGEGAVPFHAGFGNRRSDERTYLELKILYKRIFYFNPSKGGIEVKCAEHTVAAFFPGGYNSLYQFVDEFFPRVQDCAAAPPRSPRSPTAAARRVKEYFQSLLFRP